MMEVIKCGTRVLIASGEIKGTVTAASIRFDKVQYEVSYFLHGEYKVAWLDESEFEFSGEHSKQKIGFKP